MGWHIADTFAGSVESHPAAALAGGEEDADGTEAQPATQPGSEVAEGGSEAPAGAATDPEPATGATAEPPAAEGGSGIDAATDTTVAGAAVGEGQIDAATDTTVGGAAVGEGQIDAATDTTVGGAAVGDDVAPPSPSLRRLPKRPFGVGEYFVFSIQYGPIKAGTAKLSVEAIAEFEGQSTYRFASVTRSNRLFDRIYKVRDRIESFADVGELMTVRSTKKMRQGDYEKDADVRWDQEAGVVIYEDGTKSEIPRGTRDILGAFYFVRTLDLNVGDRVPLDAHDNKKTYPLWIEVLGQENIDTPVGRFDCLVVEPQLQTDGLFRRTGSLKVWLTNDDEHLPVMMQSKIKVGAISAILIEYGRGQPAADPEPSYHTN